MPFGKRLVLRLGADYYFVSYVGHLRPLKYENKVGAPLTMERGWEEGRQRGRKSVLVRKLTVYGFGYLVVVLWNQLKL